MRKMLIQSILLGVIVAAGGVSAQQTTGRPASTSSVSGSGAVESPAGANERFVRMASAANLADVQLGQLASSQGGSDAVRQYGQELAQDHASANHQLMRIASEKGLPLSQEPMPAQQQEIQRLQSMQGSAFDQAFVQHMLNDHREAIRMFGDQARTGTDSDLNRFAGSTLPTLKRHLRTAQSLASTGGSGP